MISYTDVEKLLAVHCEDPPVLSLYLQVPLDPPALHGLPARASDLLNSAAGGPCGPGPDAGRVLAHTRQVVRRLLEDRARDWLGHCVAIFLCAPAGLAEAMPVGRMGRVDDPRAVAARRHEKAHEIQRAGGQGPSGLGRRRESWQTAARPVRQQRRPSPGGVIA